MLAFKKLTALWLVVLFLATSSLLAQVHWVPKLDQAKDLAGQQKKHIILDISADWCPPCQRMAREVYPDPVFIEFSRTQIFMLLDADKDSEGVRLAGRYKVHNYPTILVLDSAGDEIDRLIGGRNSEGLIEDINLILKNPIPAGQLNRQAQQQTDDLELQIYAGERATQRYDFKRAAQFLRRAIDLSADQPLEIRSRALSSHGRAAFEAGDHEAALASLDQLAQLIPESARWSSLAMMRARSLIALKRFDESVDLLTELARGDDRAEAQKLIRDLPKKFRQDQEKLDKTIDQANKQLEKRKSAEALVLAEQALAIDPESPEAHLLLSRARIASAQEQAVPELRARILAEGLQSLLRARRLDPANVVAHRTALDILGPEIAPPIPRSEKAQKDWEKAEKNFQAGKLKEASETYIRVIQEEPTFARAYLHLGDCWFQNSQWDKALQLYTETCRRSPLDAAAHRFRADALAKLQQSEEAGQALMDSLSADPGYPMIWLNLRELAESSSRPLERHHSLVPYELMFAEAGDYETLVSLIPANTREAWQSYLDCHLLWKKQRFQEQFPELPYFHSFEEQMDCLTGTSESWIGRRQLDPDTQDDELDFLAQIYIDGHLDTFIFLEMYVEEFRLPFEKWKKDHREDIAAYLDDYIFGAPQAAAHDRYNSSAIRDYNAGVRLHRSDPEAAMDLYRKALLQEPFMDSALENLSRLLYAAEEYDGLDTWIERWILASPESADPYDIASLAKAKQGEFQQAVELVQKAIQLAQDPETRDRLERNLAAFRSRLH